MARTMSSSSGQRTSRSTSGNWIPTLIGRSATGGAPVSRAVAAAIARRWSGCCRSRRR